MQIVEPILIKTFTKDTYSAIPKRGAHLIIRQMNGYNKKCKDGSIRYVKSIFEKDPEITKYCIKLDIKKYYPSINHDVLKLKYKKIFKDSDLLWLIFEIIDSIATAKTEGVDVVNVIPKDLDVTGIPIGNYLSQYSGNLYLSDFDHWIKETKRIKHYFRYMDDIVIFGSNSQELHKLFKDIEAYLKTELKLTIKDNYQVFPSLIRGVDFVGYRFFGKFCLLRKTSCKRLKNKMRNTLRNANKNNQISHSQWCSINSYKGMLVWCDSYRLHNKYIASLEYYCGEYYKNEILYTKYELLGGVA